MSIVTARANILARIAALGSVDAILFGGGVGEHVPQVRAQILCELVRLGIVLDPDANRAAVGAEMRISNSCSEAELWVIPVDEAALLAQQALALMGPPETLWPQENRS